MKRTALRITAEMERRLDALAITLEEAQPGLQFSRAAVIRALLSSGLDTAERTGTVDGAIRGVVPPGPPSQRRVKAE